MVSPAAKLLESLGQYVQDDKVKDPCSRLTVLRESAPPVRQHATGLAPLLRLLESFSEGYDEETPAKTGAKRQQTLVQYTKHGNVYSAATRTTGIMEAGIYDIKSNVQGVYFEVHEIATDDLIRFDDPRQAQVIAEIAKFAAIKDNFKNLGMTHKRGMLLYGPPGSGKSCLLKNVIADAVSSDNVVFIVKNAHTVVEGLRQFREVEPDRMALVIMEDADELVRYNEQEILQLFDGDSQMDGFLFLATTNYLDRFPARMLRAGRFDRKIQIKHPPYEGRLAYLKQKVGINETEDQLQSIARKTEGFSFGQLRELVISTYCLEYGLEDSIARIRSGIEESISRVRWSEQDVQDAVQHRSAYLTNLRQTIAESRVLRVLKTLPEYHTLSTEGIKAAFEKKLAGFDETSEVIVNSVDFDLIGNIFVTFSDPRGKFVNVIFTIDEVEGAVAIVADAADSQTALVVDLSMLAPSQTIIGGPQASSGLDGQKYLNLLDLSWMNKNAMLSILNAGDLVTQASPCPHTHVDAFGYKRERFDEAGERVVTRGGRKVRLPILRRVKTVDLSQALQTAIKSISDRSKAVALAIGA